MFSVMRIFRVALFTPPKTSIRRALDALRKAYSLQKIDMPHRHVRVTRVQRFLDGPPSPARNVYARCSGPPPSQTASAGRISIDVKEATPHPYFHTHHCNLE
jgi:hypothetical protein